MKHQILVIHGGANFDSYDEYISSLKDYKLDFERLKTKGWKDTLQDRLGNGFEVIQPEMPNSLNARYLEWKIWFDKYIPFLEPEIVLIGHSLGGIFIAKYLAENKILQKILGTLLVAAPFDAKGTDYTLADFILPSDLSQFDTQGGQISLYHSEDDPVVPFADLAKYAKALPSARKVVFTDRQHFNQTEFPEVIKNIKDLFS